MIVVSFLWYRFPISSTGVSTFLFFGFLSSPSPVAHFSVSYILSLPVVNTLNDSISVLPLLQYSYNSLHTQP